MQCILPKSDDFDIILSKISKNANNLQPKKG